MKRTLSDHDRRRLDGLIAEKETSTGAQIVLAVIRRSDSYAELPWKAFALGASIAGLLMLIPGLSPDHWHSWVTALTVVVITLGGGAAFMLLAVLTPGFARRFLSSHRAEVEVRQYAESLFLDRELFATPGRTGVLLLVSLFERRVVILPDKGLNDRLTEDALQGIIAAMTPFLKRNEIYRAFESGLERLSRVLGTAAPGSGGNELPDEIIEEKGV